MCINATSTAKRARGSTQSESVARNRRCILAVARTRPEYPPVVCCVSRRAFLHLDYYSLRSGFFCLVIFDAGYLSLPGVSKVQQYVSSSCAIFSGILSCRTFVGAVRCGAAVLISDEHPKQSPAPKTIRVCHLVVSSGRSKHKMEASLPPG